MAELLPNTSVITALQYQQIAWYYTYAIQITAGANNYLWNAVTYAAGLNSVYPEIDLLGPFNSTYSVQTSALTSTTNYSKAAAAINQHILQRALQYNGLPYTSIDTWLTDEAAAGRTINPLPKTWVALCANVGITISVWASNTY